MKPGEHPEFFRFPAPEGRSRESEIRLDGEGHFHDHGALVEHARLAQAMHKWIAKHPDNSRYILTNGYDWTYFQVDDAPYFVRSLVITPWEVTLVLSDETTEALVPEDTRPGRDGQRDDAGKERTESADALYTLVKRNAKGGPFLAKFTRHAQSSLAPILGVDEEGRPGVMIGDALCRFGE
jgi:hypothetical protein